MSFGATLTSLNTAKSPDSPPFPEDQLVIRASPTTIRRIFAPRGSTRMQLVESTNRSANLWQRLVRGTRRVWQRTDWPNFAGSDWEDRAMSIEATDDFHAKQGRSNC